MTIVPTPKDPNAVLDYVLDWSAWLATDTLMTSTWTAPTGITKVSSSNTTTTATVWLSGGTAGQHYDLLNRITTASGRTQDETLRVTVAER